MVQRLFEKMAFFLVDPLKVKSASSGSERRGGLPSLSDVSTCSSGAGGGGGTWGCATSSVPRITGAGGEPSERRWGHRPVEGGRVSAAAAVDVASTSSIEFLEGIVGEGTMIIFGNYRK